MDAEPRSCLVARQPKRLGQESECDITTDVPALGRGESGAPLIAADTLTHTFWSSHDETGTSREPLWVSVWPVLQRIAPHLYTKQLMEFRILGGGDEELIFSYLGRTKVGQQKTVRQPSERQLWEAYEQFGSGWDFYSVIRLGRDGAPPGLKQGRAAEMTWNISPSYDVSQSWLQSVQGLWSEVQDATIDSRGNNAGFTQVNALFHGKRMCRTTAS